MKRINEHLEKFWMTLKDIVSFGSARRAYKRFQKRRAQRPVRMELQPGRNRIQFTRDGGLVADIVLVNITWHYKEETEVEFRDYAAFMKERTISKTRPPYTEAEVERLFNDEH